MGRVIKSHNLLQALTRVNRTYKSFKYGYVVDFADISKEFDITNKAYFDELQTELGDELGHYSDLFMSREEILADIEKIKDVLWNYETENLEAFSLQIEAIADKKQMIDLVKSLRKTKSLYNIIRTIGEYDLLDKLDFRMINKLHTMAQDQLNILNTKEALENNVDTTNLLNAALEDIVFKFTKVGEEELVLAGKLKDTLRKTREALGGNFDFVDPEFVSLYEELERLFKNKNLSEVSQEEMTNNIKELTKIYDAAKELNRKNQLLAAKYATDKKYARIHKRIMSRGKPSVSDRQLNEVLLAVKAEMDEDILHNSELMQNEAFFEAGVIKLVINIMKNDHGIDLDLESAKSIQALIVTEYLNEYHGIA